jgi:hypothetical protein
MDYKAKYFKYKSKYLQLLSNINQSGGATLSFEKQTTPVAAYVFHKKDGVIYFGMVRKLYENGREVIPRKSSNNTYIKDGAAGTDRKYWGKWTTVGGGVKGKKSKRITNIKAIIEELNGETGVNTFNHMQVDLSDSKLGNNKVDKQSSKTYNIKCHYVDTVNSVVIFLFEILDENTFFDTFPKEGKTSPNLLTSSFGEIDAVKSFTIDEIIKLQADSVKKLNNNFFISYSMKNLNDIILDELSLSTYKNKIKTLSDSVGRLPTELSHCRYVRDSTHTSYS